MAFNLERIHYRHRCWILYLLSLSFVTIAMNAGVYLTLPLIKIWINGSTLSVNNRASIFGGNATLRDIHHDATSYGSIDVSSYNSINATAYGSINGTSYDVINYDCNSTLHGSNPNVTSECRKDHSASSDVTGTPQGRDRDVMTQDINKNNISGDRGHVITPRDMNIDQVAQGLNERNSHLFLSVNKLGRLGNNMYQYATLLGAAHLSNRTPVIGTDFKGLKQIFQLSLPIRQSNHLHNFKKIYQHQTSIKSNYSEIDKSQENITLVGYYNNMLNFRLIRNLIRKEFRFRTSILEKANGFLNGLKHPAVRVGIHVRGTDMNDTSHHLRGYSSPPVMYFYRAMDYFREMYKDVIFVVCSDNMKWAMDHIKGQDVQYSLGHREYIDMAILASCSHVIVSQGTFSFWAGWLCNGTSVTYMDLTPQSKHIHEYHRSLQDQFNSWIGISL